MMTEPNATKNRRGLPRRRGEAWHLDKKVTVALIVSLILQTATIMYEGGKRIKQLDTATNDIAALQHEREKNNNLSERVARVEAMIESIKYTVDRIDRKLDNTK